MAGETAPGALLGIVLNLFEVNLDLSSMGQVGQLVKAVSQETDPERHAQPFRLPVFP
jgi:hypothetical protein